MALDDLEIELVTTLHGVIEALGVITKVWGPDGARDTDLYFVVVSHGGYMSIARRKGEAVGTSFGFLTDGGRGLHSHMTGVVPGLFGRGVGGALKQHQRAWCAEQGLDHITWTFDPLVRRNAWFNLIRLGASVSSYHINHYGALTDDLNAGDETDRMEARWDVVGAVSAVPMGPVSGDIVVPTPDDIEALRRGDRAAALQWRYKVRDLVVPALASGHRFVGLTVDGSFVMRASPDSP
jgi:predicted GNAT superfamily acetyltransferase